MARKTTRKSAAPAKTVTETKTEVKTTGVRKEHHTFSHIMYFLFLISVTIATYFTFQSFAALSTAENPQNAYFILALLMLGWSFLFWEFGHRVHHY